MNNSCKNTTFHPVISAIQKIAVYETKTKLYLVGSNSRESRFRVLEIDKTVTDELKIYENPHEFEQRDIRKFVNNLGYTKAISAYGILGFVRFLEGYYLILVTKRTRCAVLGMHMIYTIKDTVMIRVTESANKQPHPNEHRYIKMFSNIDLKSNFYFSYSYDLTRSLQYNMSAPRYVGTNVDIATDEPLPDWSSKDPEKNDRIEYAFRGISRKRFVWNSFLLKPTELIMQKDWMLDIIHGFVSQSNISIFGRPVHVCLIARRSTRFAGTRFLKRGANFSGDVANEVETEQIVMDGTRLCSFVQMRGSIPSHWSQDISKMVPKPQISLDLSDPYRETSGKHFEKIMFHHGSPVIILNLVKKREKRKHESILSDEILSTVKYLNQFLPPTFRMKYIHFDMARKSRGGGNVMEKLANIAESVVKETGVFLIERTQTTFQTGIVRVNCVDCLDRTNTAQFAIGKCVLGHQLFRLGFISPPKLEFDSDCVTMLERLYEDHGDTLALQYGGSQLVHRIKTYRKTAAWTSQGNDIMQTLSRYFSNTFSDTEKQHSINLFLGLYVPHKGDSNQYPAIWEIPTDYYLHNLQQPKEVDETKTLLPLTQWVHPLIHRHLPFSTSAATKIVRELIRVHSRDLEMIDSYSNYYLPFRLTVFEDNIAYQISLMARNYMPTFRTNYSPFEPGRRREGRANINNPSLTGQSSTSSTTSSTSSSMEDEDSSEEEILIDRSTLSDAEKSSENEITFKNLLPSMLEVYGSEIKNPDKENLGIYKKYVKIGKLASQTISNPGRNVKFLNIESLNNFGTDSYESVKPPVVDEKSLKIYQQFVQSPELIAFN